MIDRIKLIMEYYHLSPAQFADKIGFQRSALSHVLSGRNKASLDFVLKIKTAFPAVNLDWLTLGKGNRFGEPADSGEQFADIPAQIMPEPQDLPDKGRDHAIQEQGTDAGNSRSVGDRHPDRVSKGAENQLFKEDKPIKKIILLYDDGSFSEHVPEQ